MAWFIPLALGSAFTASATTEVGQSWWKKAISSLNDRFNGQATPQVDAPSGPQAGAVLNQASVGAGSSPTADKEDGTSIVDRAMKKFFGGGQQSGMDYADDVAAGGLGALVGKAFAGDGGFAKQGIFGLIGSAIFLFAWNNYLKDFVFDAAKKLGFSFGKSAEDDGTRNGPDVVGAPDVTAPASVTKSQIENALGPDFAPGLQ